MLSCTAMRRTSLEKGVVVVRASSSIHCLAALDLGAGVEQPFNCLIVQNRQNVQSMRRSMEWTFEDNMVDGLFLWVTLTGRRAGLTPFVQAGAEASDIGEETVEPDPRCSRKGDSRRVVLVSEIKVRSLIVLFNHSAFHWEMARVFQRCCETSYYHTIGHTAGALTDEKYHHSDISLPSCENTADFECCRLWWNPTWNAQSLESSSLAISYVSTGLVFWKRIEKLAKWRDHPKHKKGDRTKCRN